MRTRMVNGETLAILGRAMGIENGVIVDEAAQSVFENDRLYEDTFEALVGAIFLDLGLDAAMHFIINKYEQFDADILSNLINHKEIVKR